MREYAKALLYFKKSLKILVKLQGEEHGNTANSYDNIGSVY
jgi:hypothetical protein